MDLLRRRSPYSYTGSQCPTVADSVTGLINLLYEVIMPHTKMQPMAYSTPADSSIVTEVQTPTKALRITIFSLFSPSQYMAKKERKNLIQLPKSYFRRRRLLSYHLLLPFPVNDYSKILAHRRRVLLSQPFWWYASLTIRGKTLLASA